MPGDVPQSGQPAPRRRGPRADPRNAVAWRSVPALLEMLSEAAAASQDRAFRVARRVDYFRRVAQIFADMKIAEARFARLSDPADREAAWGHVHERNAERALDLALTLRGFYVKAGQLLSTRADFVPPAWTKKLATLQDDAPAMSGQDARALVEVELAAACDAAFRNSRRFRTKARERVPAFCRIYGEGAGKIPVEAVFELDSIDWDNPIGSASLASVFLGRLKDTRKRVAIKVQNVAAARLVVGDVDSLVTVGKIIEKTDLRINFTPFLAEIRRQVNKELDFSNEATTMNSVRANLRGIRNVTVPAALPGLVTPRMLVMDFVAGRNLNAIKGEGGNLPEWKKRAFGLQLLNLMSQAWGRMIFGSGLMHGDPHPGNLLVSLKRRPGLGRVLPPVMELGIIDLGQAKQLNTQSQTRLADLIMALSRERSFYSDAFVASALRATGLRFERMGSEEDAFLARAARLVFSTENVDGKPFQPFGKDSILAENGVTDIPPDLVFVIRVIQIQRGIASALGVSDFSLAEKWKPVAEEFLLSRRPSTLY